jgi:hypothetical protein
MAMPHLTAAKPVFWHTEKEEEVLHQTHGRPFREDRQNVKTELGGELEPGENQNLGEQAAELGKPLRFSGGLPAEVFEKLEILDFPPEVGVAADGVVIGKGDGIETALFGTVQDVENGDPWLLVISRRRRVNVKIDATPGKILRKGRADGDSIAGC